MSIDIYGIPNCDSVRKGRKWLDAQGVAYTFHDFKKEGVDPEALERWVDACSWQVLLNRRGTTFRQLDESDKADLDRDRALALMAAHPTLIKRPVVERAQTILVGFTQSEWENDLC